MAVKKKAPKKKTYKLDLFKQLLPNIAKKNRDFWGSLTEEEQKGFAPFVAIQFMAGTKDPAQIYYLNEIANPFIFEFGSKHKELMLDLLMVSSTGARDNKWIKKKESNHPKSLKVIEQYFVGYGHKHAEEALKCMSVDDIIGFAEELGYQDNEIKEISNEFSRS